jgi:hypothetical protein
MSTVIYEPAHDTDTMDTIERRLKRRGYHLRPFSPSAYMLPYVAAVESYDQLMVCTPSDEAPVPRLDECDSADDYAEALADAIDKLVRS